MTRILILGGGFAGVEVLKGLQKEFKGNSGVDITLVSKDNFFLFTPMLPEVSTGMIETRHIATAIRDFCKKTTKFYEGNIESIDLDGKKVVISHAIGKELKSHSLYRRTLDYDYLVIALGSETNFFGIKDMESNAFTMKDLDDAIKLRNHVISMLEQAEIADGDHKLKNKMMTFVVVGGGFSGVEVVGELNNFVRESIREYYYHNIDETKDVRVVLVHAHDKILPELGEELGDFALQKLKESNIEVILNSHATGVTEDGTGVELDKGKITIPTYTLVWTAGVKPVDAVAKIPCDHDKGGRVTVNYYLEIPDYPHVYALGDCVSLKDPHTLKPYPPTAQIAIRQGKAVAKNIISEIKRDGQGKITFDYKAKGMMANIGKRTGVAKVFGIKLQGFSAWWVWRTFYLSNLPMFKKKARVMADWTIDLFFKRDVTMIKRFVQEKQGEEANGGKSSQGKKDQQQQQKEQEQEEKHGEKKKGSSMSSVSEAA